MRVPKWAQYLGRDAYNSWQAAKFKEGMAPAVAAIRDAALANIPMPAAVAAPALPAMPSLPVGSELVPGASVGGLIKRAARRLKAGYDWFEENTKDPIAGYAQLGGGVLSGLSLATGGRTPTGGNALLRGYRRAAQAREDFGGDFSPSRAREVYRDTEMSGGERFLTDVVADPLTYLGGYGKAVSAVPGLRRVGLAIDVAEHLPGRAVARGLERAGAGVRTAVDATPGLRRLGQESIRSQASREGQRVAQKGFELVSAALPFADDIGGQADIRTARQVLSEVMNARAGRNPYVKRLIEQGGTGHARVNAVLDQMDQETFDALYRAFAPRPQRAVKHVPQNIGGTVSVKPNLESYLARAEEIATDRKRTALRRDIFQQRQAARAQGGLAKLGAEAADVVDLVGEKVGQPIERLNRFVSTAILGTPAYPLTNLPDDTARAVLAGGGRRMGAKEGERYLRGVQAELGGVLPEGIQPVAYRANERLGHRLVAGTGGFEQPSTAQRVGGLFTGQTWIDQSNRLTEPTRRGLYLTKFREAYESGKAGGKDALTAAREAVEVANRVLRDTYPGYGPESVAARAAKAVVPFFGYEAHRLPYIARTLAQYPQLGSAFAHYREAADQGEVAVPGLTDHTVNPLKGSTYNIVNAAANLFGEGFHPLEAQTATTGLSGRAERALQYAGAAGFYPNTAINAALAGLRMGERQDPEAGSLIPNTLKSGLNLASAAGLDLATNFLDDPLMTTRFREYAINQQLALMGINPEDATEEQRRQAAENAALEQAIAAQVGVVKFAPEEQQRFKADRIAAAVAAGVPEDVARRPGNPLTRADASGVRYLNAQQVKDIYEANPDFERWSQVGEPLRRKEQRAVNAETRRMYEALEALDARTEEQLRPVYAAYAAGQMSAKEFRQRRGEVMDRASAAREAVKAQYPGALQTPEQREAYYASTGRPQTLDRPEDEAARAYYDIKPAVDPNTGEFDWDGFFAQREAFLAGLPASQRQYILAQQGRRFSDPAMNAVEARYQQEQEQLRQYFALPKYKGLTPEDAEALDRALAQYRVLRMMNPRKSESWAWRQVRQAGNERGALLARRVNRLRSRERERYRRANPEIALLLSDVAPAEVGIA